MRVVLDTTFLLPAFNIQTKKFKKSDFETLIKMDIERIVNQALIIEAKWVLLGLIKKGVIRDSEGALSDFNLGLRFLRYSGKYKFIEVLDEKVDLNENEIFKLTKIKDYFDRILIATTNAYGDILLTEDNDILGIREEKSKTFNGVKILTWSEFSAKSPLA